MKRVHLRELLDFYDYRVEASNTHASAINAVLGEDLAIALMRHFFMAQSAEVEVLKNPCTTGKQRGNRLDKWIAVKSNESSSTLYQVEIKNWSAHSIGGTKVKREASQTEMTEYRRDRWCRQFKTSAGTHMPSQKETLKVLTKMLVPNSHLDHKHEALLCFWEALHPRGEDDPFFQVEVESEHFKRLWVFSLSNYTSRLLTQTTSLEVEMLETDARMDWLNRIYN